MTPTKIIIAGGRDESIDKPRIHWLNTTIKQYLPKKNSEVEIVSGAAPGIDTFAIAYARACGYKSAVFGADWTKYGTAAGPIRNKKMAEYADVCILFPGHDGTASMKSYAEKNKLTIHEWKDTTDGNQ